MKVVRFIVLTSLVALIASCKQRDPAPTPERLITHERGWKISDYTATSVPGVVTSLFFTLRKCETDNVVVFHDDHSYSEDEGPTKCKSSDPQIVETGTWTFTPGDSTLTIAPVGGNPRIASVLVTSTTLTLFLKIKSRGPYTYSEIFTAQ